MSIIHLPVGFYALIIFANIFIVHPAFDFVRNKESVSPIVQ